MRREKLRYSEREGRFDVYRKRITDWERVYLTDGAEGFYTERRGGGGAGSGGGIGRPPKLEKQLEGDWIAENQRLRAENEYLKNL